ncbi:MAG: FkbM family methyltransferase [Anaerolineales bacterium]|nr:FkbM family methyltransferase [Anaerolineales bacterium]
METKADATDFLGRFREIVSDPLNLLIKRHPLAGMIDKDLVYLHNGNKVPLRGQYSYYENFSDILVINRGVHEPLEEYVFQELMNVLPDNSSMLELGAYWGHYSMWLKKIHPKASVYLVEPNEVNIQAGKYNFQLNNCVGEFIQEYVACGQFEVDKFMMNNGLKTLSILHSDIQGFEIEMLDGSSDTLKKGLIHYAFISTHSQDIHVKVVEKLEYFGYRVEVASGFDYETTSYDGFVFASNFARPPLFDYFKPFIRKQIPFSDPLETVVELTKIINARNIKT